MTSAEGCRPVGWHGSMLVYAFNAMRADRGPGPGAWHAIAVLSMSPHQGVLFT
jgi:hypothetical protein